MTAALAAATITGADLDTIKDAAEVFGDGMTAQHVGPRFCCSEADRIAAFLKAFGYIDAAVTFLAGHAEGDEDRDPENDPDNENGDRHSGIKFDASVSGEAAIVAENQRVEDAAREYVEINL